MGLIAVFPEVDRKYKKRSIALEVARGFPQGLDRSCERHEHARKPQPEDVCRAYNLPYLLNKVPNEFIA